MRALVLGVGNPWAGDLDFGPQFVRRFESAGWPADVGLEDGALAAHLLLHRLQEVRPARVVVVAAFPRGGIGGSVRRYRLEERPPEGEDEVQARLGESAAGVIDLDHVLAVNRYFGTLPPDTTIIELEPASLAFAGELSPAAESAMPRVLALVREAVAA